MPVQIEEFLSQIQYLFINFYFVQIVMNKT